MATARAGLAAVPDSLAQVGKLARYQLREYLRSRRFLALVAIIGAIGAILTGLLGYYRPSALLGGSLAFYSDLWGGVTVVIVLAAVFFGGDAIAGEFQNKTGYFLMGLPVRRTTVYVGKFLAAFLASVAMVLLFLAIVVGNGVFYLRAAALPWQLGVSLVLAIVYLAAVLGATFLFSSLFKTSAYGFVLTAILFLFGFTILQELVTDLVGIEPWMVISYAASTITNVFGSGVNWGLAGQSSTVTEFRTTTTTWTAGIAEGVVIMIAYLVVTAAVGLWRFEREEFT